MSEEYTFTPWEWETGLDSDGIMATALAKIAALETEQATRIAIKWALIGFDFVDGEWCLSVSDDEGRFEKIEKLSDSWAFTFLVNEDATGICPEKLESLIAAIRNCAANFAKENLYG